METNKELMRAEFEAWAMKDGYKIHMKGNQKAYPSAATQSAWEIWQAALSQRSEAVPSAAAGEQVENDFRKEADRLYNRLMSDDPDHNDCTDAANFIRKILGDVIGPDGYATWKDAAIAERLRRVKAESDLAAQPTPAQGDAVPVALSDEDIVSVLHGCGIDTHPSKYGFTELQVSATSIPSIREVVRRCNELLATRQSSADAGDAARGNASLYPCGECGESVKESCWRRPCGYRAMQQQANSAAIAAQGGKGEKE